MIGVGFYSIWHARNVVRFHEEVVSINYVVRSIKCQLLEINSLNSGYMKNYVEKLCILHSIGVRGRPAKAPKIIEVMWCPPS